MVTVWVRHKGGRSTVTVKEVNINEKDKMAYIVDYCDREVIFSYERFTESRDNNWVGFEGVTFDSLDSSML